MIVCGGGAFWRWLAHEDGAFMDGISAFIKETAGSSLTPSAIWGNSKKMSVYEPETGLSRDAESASALILELPASRTVRNRLLLFITAIFCYSILNRLRQGLQICVECITSNPSRLWFFFIFHRLEKFRVITKILKRNHVFNTEMSSVCNSAMMWYKVLDLYKWFSYTFYLLHIVETIFNAQGALMPGDKHCLIFVF